MQTVSSLNGISFPFRISSSGGVAMSSVTNTSIAHITEKINIVLSTFAGDRTMEPLWGSQVDTLVFNDNDTATHTLLEYHVENALRKLQEYISVESVQAHGDENYVYVDIKFKLLEYDRVYTLSNVKVGEMNNG